MLKISEKILHIISNRFFDIEKGLIRLVIYLIEFENGSLGKTNLSIKEKQEDNSIKERKLESREEYLEIVFLPLEEFKDKYIEIEDENGNVFNNEKLLAYREMVQSKYERMACRVVSLSLIGFTVGVCANVLANWICSFIPS